MGTLISLFIQAISLTISLMFSVLFTSLRAFGLLLSIVGRSARSRSRPARRSIPKAGSGGTTQRRTALSPAKPLVVVFVALLIVLTAFGASPTAGVVATLLLVIVGVLWLWRRSRSPRTVTGQQLAARFGRVSSMSGSQFEVFAADLLRAMGYGATVLGGSGDQGVDIIATGDSDRIAIQCKNYRKAVGNKPVQEVYAGARHHGCSKAWVVAPAGFTRGAFDLAKSVGVTLFDSSSINTWIAAVDKIANQPTLPPNKLSHAPEGGPLARPLERSAVELAIGRDRLAVSDIARAVEVSYSEAGRIMDALEKRGVVGEFNPSGARFVLVSDDEIRELLERC